MKYQKNLEPIQQKIHELLDSDAKASKQDNNIQASDNLKRVRRISSQTELKRPVSAETKKPDTDAELKVYCGHRDMARRSWDFFLRKTLYFKTFTWHEVQGLSKKKSQDIRVMSLWLRVHWDA